MWPTAEAYDHLESAVSPVLPVRRRAARLATARRLLGMHVQRPEPGERFCSWCMKCWPCPRARWAARTIRAAES